MCDGGFGDLAAGAGSERHVEPQETEHRPHPRKPLHKLLLSLRQIHPWLPPLHAHARRRWQPSAKLPVDDGRVGLVPERRADSATRGSSPPCVQGSPGSARRARLRQVSRGA